MKYILMIILIIIIAMFNIEHCNGIKLYSDEEKVIEFDNNNLMSTIYNSQQVLVLLNFNLPH